MTRRTIHTAPRTGLEGLRDQAFCRYGRLQHLQSGDSSLTISVNPRTPHASTGRPIGQIGDLILGADRRPLLAEAFARLKGWGCPIVRGPISRHTWYPFRVVTSGFSTRPAFSGEPQNAPELRAQLTAAGFSEVAWYASTIGANTTDQVAASAPQLQHLHDAGYTTRALDANHLQRDLGLIHALTLRTFKRPFNYLFAPIDAAELRLVLGPKTESLRADLILLCHAKDGSPAGFCYATAEAAETGCVKTLAVAPEHRGHGVGAALTALAHQSCAAAGLKHVIHALMRQDGPSRAISSAGHQRIFRRYAVMERPL